MTLFGPVMFPTIKVYLEQYFAPKTGCHDTLATKMFKGGNIRLPNSGVLISEIYVVETKNCLLDTF